MIMLSVLLNNATEKKYLLWTMQCEKQLKSEERNEQVFGFFDPDLLWYIKRPLLLSGI